VSETQLAWREGGRITRDNGTGYSDVVMDADIVRHAITHMDLGRYEDARWCLAVLDLRLDERARKAATLNQRA
jgi:hypothetical protein